MKEIQCYSLMKLFHKPNTITISFNHLKSTCIYLHFSHIALLSWDHWRSFFLWTSSPESPHTLPVQCFLSLLFHNCSLEEERVMSQQRRSKRSYCHRRPPPLSPPPAACVSALWLLEEQGCHFWPKTSLYGDIWRSLAGAPISAKVNAPTEGSLYQEMMKQLLHLHESYEVIIRWPVKWRNHEDTKGVANC